jgi:aryl-alcohol dehydrogenase-like predicted oxidoreductase
MRYRELGNTELNCSVIGLGCWAIGGGNWAYGWGPQDEGESISTIYTALDRGINWIDTAPVYGLGNAEKVVGNALQRITDKPYIATKCGLVWNEKRKIKPRLTAESVGRELEASLRRLKVNHIDLYQIHWPNPDEQIEEAWEAIARFRAQGKIRYGGVSNFSMEQILRCQHRHAVASLQPPYSMLKRNVESDLLPFCRENGIGVVTYSPLQKGLLTGAVTRERIEEMPVDDHRKYDSDFKEPELSTHLAMVERLKAIAQREGKTVAQLAVAWILRREEVTAAIVGARKPSQIEETVQAGDWVMSTEIIDEIGSLLEESN